MSSFHMSVKLRPLYLCGAIIKDWNENNIQSSYTLYQTIRNLLLFTTQENFIQTKKNSVYVKKRKIETGENIFHHFVNNLLNHFNQ